MSKNRDKKLYEVHNSSGSRARIVTGNLIHEVLSTAMSAIYIHVQNIEIQCVRHSLNDRAYEHVYNLKNKLKKTEICHSEELGQCGKLPCKPYFPSFLQI